MKEEWGHSRYRMLLPLRHIDWFTVSVARPACLSGLKNLSYQSCAHGKPVSNRITWSCNIWKTRAYQREWVVWKYSLWLLGFFKIMGTTLTQTSNIWVDAAEIWVSIWPQICLFTLNTIPSLIQPFCINYLGKRKTHGWVKSKSIWAILTILAKTLWQLFLAYKTRPISKWMGREPCLHFQCSPGHKNLKLRVTSQIR